MRQLSLAALCLAALVTSASAQAPAPGPLQILPPTISQDLRIVWEVKNRFRLFRREQDFLRHVAALNLKTVLAAEQQMAVETDGRGWAAPLLSYLCVDTMGALMNTCERDGQRESYLAPADYRVEMRLVGAPPQTTCSWVFDEGDGQPRSYNGPCGEEVRIRLAAGKPTVVTVDAAVPDGPPQRATTEIVVRDLLIAGLGELGRGGRRQSGPAGRAVRRGLLLPPLHHRGAQRILPAGPRRLQRRPHLRERARGKRPRGVERARRALAEPGVPPLALRLSVAHRVGARGREPACRGDVPAARLHRGVDRQRRALLAARARAQLHHQPAMPEHGAGAGHAAAAISHRARGADGRIACSISCCSPSGRTISISPVSSPT